MFLYGDELDRTQGGNNNAYCQDNPTAWIDWKDADDSLDFQAFVSGVLQIRQSRHLLRSARFHHGEPVREDGPPDVTWYRANGGEMTSEDWTNGHAGRVALVLRELGQRSIAALFNPSPEDFTFTVPPDGKSGIWRVLIDSARGAVTPDWPDVNSDNPFMVPARSLSVLEARDTLR